MRISPGSTSPRAPAPEQIAAAIIIVTAAAVLAYRFSPLGAASAHRTELPPPPPLSVQAYTRPLPQDAAEALPPLLRVELFPAREEPYVGALLSALYEQLDACPTILWVDIRRTPLRGEDNPRPPAGATRLTVDHRDLREDGHGASRRLACQLLLYVETGNPADRRELVFAHDARIEGAESPAAWYRASAEAAAPVVVETLCGLPGPGVQGIPQGIAEEVEGKDQQEDRERDEGDLPPDPLPELEPGVADHDAP
jgi:hypothetical protein